ncbi:MAG: outer membrane protein transport protein [Rhodomicrobiaceae bacterium]
MSETRKTGRLRWALTVAVAVGAGSVLSAALITDAKATDGYFQDGYGARQKALGGAGVADTKDATAIANNPAGLADVDNQLAGAITLFSPQREYEAGLPGCTPPAFGCAPVPPGEHGSDRNLFAIPNIAYTHRIDSDTVFALGMYGNGGMNTTYPDRIFSQTSGSGVDLTQALISAAIARRIGRFSFGIAPILAVQVFEATGVDGFAPFSSDPANLSNTDYDFSFGGGVRAGIQYNLTDNVRLGIAGNSRLYMTKFQDYRGLFAEQGDFDIPASITAGIAVDVRPNLTLMFDYKHIFYSDVASIANPQSNIFNCNPLVSPPSGPGCLGNDNGAGFGWHDIDIFKVGIEWQADDRWTWRAGYSYNESPIKSADVTFNILAPGVVQHHITGGFKYKWSDDLDLEMAAVYVPESSVSGTNPFGAGQPVEIRMHQYEATLGAVWHLGGEKELEPLK